VVIPTDAYISITITSTDVIHSWAVPQLGIKVDAVPGRIANAILYTFMDGVYYGQCSELCGVLHGFMPICVESVPLDLFFC
jgi:heme/copper-type cytochrome/quinol oxidase subunit 2